MIRALSLSNVSIALKAVAEIKKRNASIDKHWEMNIQRCQYHADIAQRRFEQVDPANRLVAASLEKAWSQELEKLALDNNEYQKYKNKNDAEFPPHKITQITSLAKEIPTLFDESSDIKSAYIFHIYTGLGNIAS